MMWMLVAVNMEEERETWRVLTCLTAPTPDFARERAKREGGGGVI
uniref:Uncharacterized protein n=1 Tax=Arundo donax TaxID=35708 RepID=A0A0A9HQS3_ARUDO